MTQEKKNGWGGARPNSGRPKGDKTHKITIKVNDEAYLIYRQMKEKHDTIQSLILLWGQEKL